MFLSLQDLYADSIVMFQRKTAPLWNLVWCFVVPVLVSVYGWGETWWLAALVPGVLRYVFVLHCTWCVNSVAHMWGGHPYDEHAATAENGVVALLSIGEGWHNWHHAFPHDYAASELGVSAQFNPTKLFIDLMARLGQVWGRKRADTMWERRKEGRVKVREPTLYTPFNPIYTTTVYDVGHAVCY